jgi:hypothetical protein
VRILEVDAEQRLSLSLKRVEDGMPIQPGRAKRLPPTIDLSEDVFSDRPRPRQRSSRKPSSTTSILRCSSSRGTPGPAGEGDR